MAARHPERDALLEAARALGPRVRAAAHDAARDGVLGKTVVEGLVEARLLDAYRPVEVGGLEADALTLLELVEEVSSQDGSTGWCLGMAGVIGGLAAAALPEPGLDAVFRAAGPTLCAGGFVPRLKAKRSDGGYRVTGRFPFASGCRFADWMVVTGIVEGDPGMEAMRTFCIPASEVRILDNWQVAGLEGTSSNDLEVEDRFVPETHSFASLARPAARGGELWQLPVLAIAAVGHLGFALGTARHSLDAIAAYAETRRFASAAPIAERPVFQRDFAEARTKLRAARLAAFDALERVVDAGALASVEMRADLAATTVYAYRTGTEVAEFAFRAGGASSLYLDGELQRCHRDLQAGAQHVVASEEGFERAGQVYLGVGTPGLL